MFCRLEERSRLILGLNICRLSRGKTPSVDFNKDFNGFGSSEGLRPES
jgi:hypothetical protein